MERGGLGRSLSSILSGAREVREDAGDADAGDAAGETPSLTLAYQALTLLVDARRLQDAVVVVDEPTLGRQLLAAGRRPLTNADETLVDGPSGCWTEPPTEANDLELELVQRVCSTALHAAVRAPDPGSPVDALELALRALPGVYGVAIDTEDPIVEVYAAGDTEPDLARRVGSLARAHLEDVLTVDLVRRRTTTSRTGFEPPAAPTPTPPTPVPSAEPSTAPPAPPNPTAELLAAHTLPGYSTIEVRLRGDGAPRVGHGPRQRGLAGAVAAVLDASATTNLALLWVRTTRTTRDGRCTVAVALRSRASGTRRYGTGDGANPIEAAAQAAVHAVTAPEDTAPVGAEPV